MDLQKDSEHQIEEPVAAGIFEVELEAPAVLEQAEVKKTAASPLRESLERFRRDKRAMISLITLIVVLLVAVILPPIYQHIGSDIINQVSPTFALTVPSTKYHSPDYQD